MGNSPAPTHQHPQKIHHYPYKTHHHTTQKPPNHRHPHHHNSKKKKKKKIRGGQRDREGSAIKGDDLTKRRTARFRRHELGAVILKAQPWHNREGGVILVWSWCDQDNEIGGDDLIQRRMACLGLGRWVELDGTSSISLSPVSLRALSVSLSLVSLSLSLWCLSPKMVWK